jgi:hypothetical protein
MEIAAKGGKVPFPKQERYSHNLQPVIRKKCGMT